MKKIIALGASNSKNSINKKLATWAAGQVAGAQVDILDLNDFEMPIYSIDRERASGIPELALGFKIKIKESDGIIMSFAEHNGSYTTAFKNVLDWVSRLDGKIWEGKPLLLLATSPGPRGAMGVLNAAKASFPYQGGIVSGSFSLGSFNANFDAINGIQMKDLRARFNEHLVNFIKQMNEMITEERPVA